MNHSSRSRLRRSFFFMLEADKGGAAGGGAAEPAKPAAEEPAKPAAEPAKPAEEPAKPAEPAKPETAAVVKPSVFARAGAFIKDKTALLAEITGLKATVANRDETITQLRAEVAKLTKEKGDIETGMTALEAQLDDIAGIKAVDIAASQGTQALPTKPETAAAAEKDEVTLAYETAANESDPLKRARLYSKAAKLLSKQQNSDN